jgi:hypothetical protein
LKKAMRMAAVKPAESLMDKDDNRGLGLEIVRLLSEDLKLEIGDDNMTTVRVVRKREDV